MVAVNCAMREIQHGHGSMEMVVHGGHKLIETQI